jgi:cysteine desulfurase
VARLRDRLADGLVARVPATTETGFEPGPVDRSGRVAGICHVGFEGIESEALLFLLDEAGLGASAGSSCASGAMAPSHVLTAMGIDRARAFAAVRLSLGYASTDADVDTALDVIPAAVQQLRDHG